ncbi:HigB_toxin, RelE-like toxic component of a toxin-antitoxin system [Dyadobacter sp. SG02]|uniref:type II toxin-antitoxin system HigB family toxin n=1 Tax=Dyadobacter sp. SG02 TaxID=1855291 RepID=UPI0008CD8535|nr:type II toxin-antitoxin system HigB family toxin [Dyadobacter sp. SG02]SEI46029.1 HigB_toxin, RelE-like toxic component of a toxin-antitoxin system [Dyadobacter sp. SG02]
MEIKRKSILNKLVAKNHGNKRLEQAIHQLIADLEQMSFASKGELLEVRKDADRVHGKDFYFFDLHVHRTLVFVQFKENLATIIWAGTHAEYVRTFKNNTNTIEKWLRERDLLN